MGLNRLPTLFSPLGLGQNTRRLLPRPGRNHWVRLGHGFRRVPAAMHRIKPSRLDVARLQGICDCLIPFCQSVGVNCFRFEIVKRLPGCVRGSKGFFDLLPFGQCLARSFVRRIREVLNAPLLVQSGFSAAAHSKPRSSSRAK